MASSRTDDFEVFRVGWRLLRRYANGATDRIDNSFDAVISDKNKTIEGRVVHCPGLFVLRHRARAVVRVWWGDSSTMHH